MSARNVRDPSGQVVGSVRKFVGKTAQSMGSDPAYVAYPDDRDAMTSVHESWSIARDEVLRQARAVS